MVAPFQYHPIPMGYGFPSKLSLHLHSFFDRLDVLVIANGTEMPVSNTVWLKIQNRADSMDRKSENKYLINYIKES